MHPVGASLLLAGRARRPSREIRVDQRAVGPVENVAVKRGRSAQAALSEQEETARPRAILRRNQVPAGSRRPRTEAAEAECPRSRHDDPDSPAPR